MLKKFIDLFKRRRYLEQTRRSVLTRDDKRVIKEDISKIKDEVTQVRRRRIELKVFKEVLEDDNRKYSESEINYLYNSIIKQKQFEK
ncbi:hypothetical protein [Aquimarina algiphila]|uniref:Uncharacterized protein n=1 Tax=Aquimarina algiphila TaxID=2047982 RepID=A0A554VL17_9FLAO|nr:hypothetical protein [Aquimarina algiphila]TSE08788.1 hypothetical protein FOF46_10820 [Aquimarina algiphila]